MAKKGYRRELIEWIVLVTVGLTLYVTGLHTTVISQIQRIVLATGVISPDKTDSETMATYDFNLTDVNGETVAFQEYRDKTVFLNFWATWCSPCIAEMPDIAALHEDLKDEVHFVLISVDKDPEKAKAFIDRKQYEIPIYFSNSPLPKEFQHRSIPTTFVISPSGKIVIKQTGMAKYSSDSFRDYLSQLE